MEFTAVESMRRGLDAALERRAESGAGFGGYPTEVVPDGQEVAPRECADVTKAPRGIYYQRCGGGRRVLRRHGAY